MPASARGDGSDDASLAASSAPDISLPSWARGPETWEPGQGAGVGVTCAVGPLRTEYGWELLTAGAGSRLVITPLTDRAFLTPAMAMRLGLGGTPAGQACTGQRATGTVIGQATRLPPRAPTVGAGADS